MLPGLAGTGPDRAGRAIPAHTSVVERRRLNHHSGNVCRLADGIWSPQWAKGGILRIKVRNR